MSEKRTGIQTVCANCIFNSSDEDILCGLGRYEKFMEQQVVSEDGKTIMRLCSACRDDKWAENKDDIYLSVKSELQNIYSLIIVDDGDIGVLERLKLSLGERQTINPREIIIVYSSDSGSLSEISAFISDYVKGTEIKYRVLRAFPDKSESYSCVSREILDMAIKSATGMFYTLIKNGETIPNDSLEAIYRSVDILLQKVAFIKPLGSSISGMTVLRAFHVMVNGNFLKNIEEKFDEAVLSEGTGWMIKTWEDIRGQS